MLRPAPKHWGCWTRARFGTFKPNRLACTTTLRMPSRAVQKRGRWASRSLLEPTVAVAYTQQTGNRVRKVDALVSHPPVLYMLANLGGGDRWAADVQIPEC